MTRLALILALSASCAGAPAGSRPGPAVRAPPRYEPEEPGRRLGFRVVRRPRRQPLSP